MTMETRGGIGDVPITLSYRNASDPPPARTRASKRITCRGSAQGGRLLGVRGNRGAPLESGRRRSQRQTIRHSPDSMRPAQGGLFAPRSGKGGLATTDKITEGGLPDTIVPNAISRAIFPRRT